MHDIGEAVGRINAELSKSGPPHRFSREATITLLALQARYLGDLGVESVRVSKHKRSDSVSEYY